MLCAKFSWNGPSGFWEEVENKKGYRWTDRQMMDGRRSEKLTRAFSLVELKFYKRMDNGSPHSLNFFLRRNAEKRYTGIWCRGPWFPMDHVTGLGFITIIHWKYISIILQHFSLHLGTDSIIILIMSKRTLFHVLKL